MAAEAKAVAALVCETSYLAGSSPVSRPQLGTKFMEGAAEWTATGLENQGMALS